MRVRATTASVASDGTTSRPSRYSKRPRVAVNPRLRAVSVACFRITAPCGV